ncbi:MAG: hypothetical protein K2X43_21640, partial [Hyphomonadaceae bacterium]|nr:hypothetical protein [Hyphomonadaceae bacterium]
APWRRRIDAAANRAAAIALVSLGVVVILNAALAPSAPAADASEPASAVRVAAAGVSRPEAFAFRHGWPVREAEIEAGLKLLLAQHGPPATVDPASGPASRPATSDDTILVAFAASVPHSLDEDIARQHGLELIDRTELAALGWRVVRYRAPAHRPIAAIVAELRDDQRIRGAQGSIQYGLSVPGAPATEVSGLEERAGAARHARRGEPPQGPVRRSLDGRAVAASRDAGARHDRPRTTEMAGARKGGRSGEGGRALASAGQMALRFPTADEPFVNVGVPGR